MGKLVNIAKGQNTLHVVKTIRKVSVDAIRAAIEEAERDLDTIKVVKSLAPDYLYEDGTTVNERYAEKLKRIQELKTDLHGDC
jgi:hypothetical protein